MNNLEIGYYIFAFSTIVWIATLWIRGSYRFHKLSFWTWIIVGVITLFNHIVWRLTGSGFNQSIPYHLQFGMEGAGVTDFYQLQILVGVAIITILLLFYFIRYKFKSITYTSHFYYFPVFLNLIVTISHPLIWEIFSTYFNSEHTNIPVSKYYKLPKTAKHLDAKKYNLVWIYAESLERTYFNDSLFPGLTPNLKKLESKSLSFSNVHQVYGTSWTIAGISASHTGTPLITMGINGNELSKMKSFLPGAISITDILHQHQYQVEFLQGSSGWFAGTNKYMKSHHVNLTDLDKLKDSIPGIEARDWGMYDDALFNLASSKFLKLQETHKPFALFISTIDTHNPIGRISPNYKGKLYGDGSNSILNSIHYSDSLIVAFVDSIKSMDKANNTLVVISSDHLAMPNKVIHLLNQLNRRNLLLYYWPEKIPPSINHRSATTFDEGATAMHLLGFEYTPIGFGRSLIGIDSTLMEQFPTQCDKILHAWEPQLNFVWKNPR